MLEFFFNYSRATWERAEFVYSSGWPLPVLGLVFLVGTALLLWMLWRQPLSVGRKCGIALMQFAMLGIALWMLWRPALQLESMQPGENSIAYLLDTSLSMQNRDGGSQSRLDRARELLDDPALSSNAVFDASLYSMANSLESLESLNNLPQDNQRSRIAQSVQDVLESVSDQALAAVVLFSDGADNTEERDVRWWQAIKAAGVPVHTVGFGDLVQQQDIELADVMLDEQTAIDATVSARLRVVHNGLDVARVRVLAGDQLLYAEDLDLSDKPAEFIHSISFNSGEAGVRNLRFSIESEQSENNTINNVQQRILRVADDPKRILYVEGEPRWEYKFIRRSLTGYKGVEIVSLLRTSPNKFYRQGVKDANELADGFPKSRDALFQYDAVIIGSLEAAELDASQQANLRDYVNIRGGSLLLIGGRNGLADGGWGRSAVATALPVVLSGSNNVSDYARIRASVEPTGQGYRTTWLRLEPEIVDDVSAVNGSVRTNTSADNSVDQSAVWSQLPELADVQSVGEPKPGSTVLLNAIVGGRTQPLLVWQRYGQGQSYVLGTSGTWRWQMRLPSENQWHENFWQQLLAHLASGALPQLSFNDVTPVVRDANEFPISITARQSDFEPLSSGEITVNVDSPSGTTEQVVLRADINQPGRYVGSVNAVEDGPYAVSVVQEIAGEAAAAAANLDQKQMWWIRESNSAEYFNTAQNQRFLQRLASETGGEYLRASNAGDLSELLTSQNAGVTRENTLPLWNMPILFALLLLGKMFEWLLRLRWKRL